MRSQNGCTSRERVREHEKAILKTTKKDETDGKREEGIRFVCDGA